MRTILACVFVGCFATSGFAQSLGEKILGGIQKGAERVGEGAENVADAVEGTIESTTELFRSDEDPNQTRAMLDATADASIARLLKEQPDATALYEQAAGIAVFDVRKVTLVGFSGGAGRGVAIETGSGGRTYMNMTTAGVGLALGIGGFESQMVMMFEDKPGFDSFVQQGFDASANAGTMFGDEKSEIEVEFRNGRAVFVLTNKGWRIAVSSTGSKFWPDKDLN